MAVGIEAAELEHLSVRATMRRSVVRPSPDGAPVSSEGLDVTDDATEISLGAVLG